jgi:glycosyltransferase involved in cell wall biosynthesis
MKILFLSNSVKTYSLVFKNELEVLSDMGHEIIWAANFDGFIGNVRDDIPFKTINIPLKSHPLHWCNYRSFKQLFMVCSSESFDAIICTTPIGGFIGRFLGKKAKIKKVIYSAHGFLFYKGCPLIKKIIYRFQEKIMARWTDYIVTITNEDYQNALQFKLKKGGKVFLIHGAGVKVGTMPTKSKKQMRSELGIDDKDFVITSAGFLNKNKNNCVVIKSLKYLKKDLSDFKYLICGEGEEEQKLKKLTTKLKLENNVLFLGFRTDLQDILNCSDLFVMPSYREGVPRSLLEAMDLGLPCAGSDTRGIRELIDEPKGGLLFNPNQPRDVYRVLKEFALHKVDLNSIFRRNKKEVEHYSCENVVRELTNIYQEIL